MHHDQMRLSQRCKNFSITANSVKHYINKLKTNNHIILIDAEKSFDKIQHSFMIKKNSLENVFRGNLAQHTKGHVW